MFEHFVVFDMSPLSKWIDWTELMHCKPAKVYIADTFAQYLKVVKTVNANIFTTWHSRCKPKFPRVQSLCVNSMYFKQKRN